MKVNLYINPICPKFKGNTDDIEPGKVEYSHPIFLENERDYFKAKIREDIRNHEAEKILPKRKTITKEIGKFTEKIGKHLKP